MAEEVIEHSQGFAAQDDQGFADGSPLMAVVGESLGEATGIALEGGGDEVEDVAEQGVAPFGEATAAGEAAGWVEGDVEAGIGDEGLAVGEAVQGAGEGKEEGGQAGSEAREGPEEAPGLGVMRAHGLWQSGQAAGAPGLQESPAIQEEREGWGPDGVVEAEGSPGPGLEGLQVQAVAGWESLLEVLVGGLGEGMGGGEVAKQGAQGFGEAGVGPLPLGEEEGLSRSLRAVSPRRLRVRRSPRHRPARARGKPRRLPPRLPPLPPSLLFELRQPKPGPSNR